MNEPSANQREEEEAGAVGEAELRRALGVETAEKMALRMQDRECVTRLLAFLDSGVDDYRKGNADFDGFLFRVMKRPETSDRPALRARFLRAMAAARACFGRNAFRKVRGGRRGPVNKALFEATAVNLDRRTDEELRALATKGDALLAAYQKALLSSEFNEAVSVGTGERRKVERRFSVMKDVIDEALR